MAKKKKQELTMEDKLEQALVPEDEQPYEIPSNWIWVNLGVIASFHQGIQVSVDNQFNQISKDRIRFIRIIDYTQNTNDERYVEKSLIRNESLVNGTDIVMVRYGASAGFIGQGLKGMIANNMFKINVNNKINHYVTCYLKSPQVYYLLNNSGGSTAMPAINFKLVSAVKIPFPPLAEQHRIVNRIESLFEKLDQAKELAQDNLDTFETRKAAIFYKVFTGELTAGWREKNDVKMVSWKKMKLGELTKIVGGGTPSTSIKEYYDNGSIPWITPADLSNYKSKYISKGKKSITTAGLKNSSAKMLPKGTVMLSSRAPIGYVAIANNNICTNQGFKSFLPNDDYYAEYLYYYLIAMRNELETYASGTTFLELSAKRAAEIPFIMPSILEQKEICRILNHLLEKEEQAKELCEGIIERIELMKKAILARAFRGELGTNDPSEESSLELLKNVYNNKSNRRN